MIKPYLNLHLSFGENKAGKGIEVDNRGVECVHDEDWKKHFPFESRGKR